MKYILQSKHWQLFAILILSSIIPNMTPLIDSIIGVSVFAVLLGWLWGIGVVLNDKYDFTLSNGSFKAALLFFTCYAIAIQLLVGYFNIYLNKSNWIFVPLAILAILCLLYCFLFCARTLKAIESNGQAASSDCWGYFFLLFCFPIGIWIIQPKINQMYSGTYSTRKKTTAETYKPNPTIRKAINMLIGFGALAFILGLILGSIVNKYFEILIPFGTSSAIFGSILFLVFTDLKREFENTSQDSMGYFWDKIILKLWTLALLLWMFLVNKEMFF